MRTSSQPRFTAYCETSATESPVTMASVSVEFGKPLVNSTLTLAIVTGLSVADVSQYAVNLGWDEVRMPAPVFEGDTIYAQTSVLSRRESKSRPNMGIVEIKTSGFKPDGTIVMEFRR